MKNQKPFKVGEIIAAKYYKRADMKKFILWTTLKPGDLCYFDAPDSRIGLVEILKVDIDTDTISIQKLNGTTDHHGHHSETQYLNCFYALQ